MLSLLLASTFRDLRFEMRYEKLPIPSFSKTAKPCLFLSSSISFFKSHRSALVELSHQVQLKSLERGHEHAGCWFVQTHIEFKSSCAIESREICCSRAKSINRHESTNALTFNSIRRGTGMCSEGESRCEVQKCHFRLSVHQLWKC